MYAEIQKCRNYEELEVLVDSLDENSFEDLHHQIMAAGPDAVVDGVAAYHFPSDGMQNLVPIVTDTDGNCFCRAISRSLFRRIRRRIQHTADEDHHQVHKEQAIISR